MTEQEQRIAIAESQGWEVLKDTTGRYKLGRKKGINGGDWTYLPDYPNDLNACHEFEESLLPFDYSMYELELGRVVVRHSTDADWASGLASPNAHMSHAKAKYRCEAFLRFKKLWKD